MKQTILRRTDKGTTRTTIMNLDGKFVRFEQFTSRSKKRETWTREFDSPKEALSELAVFVKDGIEIGCEVEGYGATLALEKPPAQSKPKKFARQPWLGKLSAPLEKQRAKIARLLARAKLGHRAAEIEALARPGATLTVKKVKKAPDGVVSRLGGDPDLDGAWPLHGKQPLHFVGQIVLADIAPFDLERILPTKGHLAFFAQLDHLRDDYAEVGAVVHVTGKTKRVPSPVPSQLEAIGLLTPTPILTLPYYEDPAMLKLELDSDEHSAYHDEVFLALLPDQTRHQILGHASAGTGYSLDGKRFLAQFADDDRVGFSEGDAQTLRYYVTGKSVTSVGCTLEEA